MNRTNLVRAFIFLATTVGAWALLSLSTGDPTGFAVDGLAARDYVARSPAEVVDEAATETNRQAAADAVPTQLFRDESAEEGGFADIESILSAVLLGVVDQTAPVPGLRLPEQVTATTSGSSTTVATVSFTVTGQVFLDGTEDGVFSTEAGSADRGLRAVSVLIFDEFGAQIVTADTQSNGTWQAQVTVLPAWVAVDGTDPEFPPSLTLAGDNDLQPVECDETTCVTNAVAYRPAVRPFERQSRRTADRRTEPRPDLGRDPRLLCQRGRASDRGGGVLVAGGNQCCRPGQVDRGIW